MLRNFSRTLVMKNSRNKLLIHRNSSDISIPTLVAVGGTFFAALAGYSTFGVWILKMQLLPLQKGIDKLSTEVKEMRMESKQSFDKLEMESKQSFDKLEMQMKDSNDKINSRVYAVLLCSLDLQRVPKPTDE